MQELETEITKLGHKLMHERQNRNQREGLIEDLQQKNRELERKINILKSELKDSLNTQTRLKNSYNDNINTIHYQHQSPVMQNC